MGRKKVLILGSTGSIGVNALAVIERFPDRFEVFGLTAHDHDRRLIEQARRFRPRYLGIRKDKIDTVRGRLGDDSIEILDSTSELGTLAALPEVDIVVIGVSGRAALEPFLAAAAAGKVIAPANKEALVIAGDFIMAEARASGARVIPVDSEQSAIFQCLEGRSRDHLEQILLTASGGILKDVAREEFSRLSVDDVLVHPRWSMGPKITVDSATLMNKGFEVIEAMRLFDVRADQVTVVIHPEAIVHSMVRLTDGAVLAQLGITDMRLPIQYALTYPERLSSGLPQLDLVQLHRLTFEAPDLEKFPSLRLAYDVAERSGTWPAVLNAADEVAVQGFLDGKLPFVRIYDLVEQVVGAHRGCALGSLEDVLEADAWARHEARKAITARAVTV